MHVSTHALATTTHRPGAVQEPVGSRPDPCNSFRKLARRPQSQPYGMRKGMSQGYDRLRTARLSHSCSATRKEVVEGHATHQHSDMSKPRLHFEAGSLSKRRNSGCHMSCRAREECPAGVSSFKTYHYVIGFGRLLCSCSVSWGFFCAGMVCVNVWVKGPFRLNRYTQHCIASSHSTASRVHTALHREATFSFEHRSVCRKTNMQVVLIGIRRRALG